MTKKKGKDKAKYVWVFCVDLEAPVYTSQKSTLESAKRFLGECGMVGDEILLCKVVSRHHVSGKDAILKGGPAPRQPALTEEEVKEIRARAYENAMQDTKDNKTLDKTGYVSKMDTVRTEPVETRNEIDEMMDDMEKDLKEQAPSKPEYIWHIGNWHYP